jgi:hypothetical protein
MGLSSAVLPVGLPLFAGPRRESNLDVLIRIHRVGHANHKAAKLRSSAGPPSNGLSSAPPSLLAAPRGGAQQV